MPSFFLQNHGNRKWHPDPSWQIRIFFGDFKFYRPKKNKISYYIYHADCTLHSFRESLLLIECQNLQHVVHKRKLLQKNIKKEERKKNQKFKVKGAVLFLIELVKR